MDKSKIFLIVFLLAISAFRIYQKYKKKDTAKSETDAKNLPESNFSSSSKDDDYEPYSKK